MTLAYNLFCLPGCTVRWWIIVAPARRGESHPSRRGLHLPPLWPIRSGPLVGLVDPRKWILVALTARDSGPSLLCRRVLRTCFCLQCEPPHHISVSSKNTYHQHIQPHLVFFFLFCFVTTTYLCLLGGFTILRQVYAGLDYCLTQSIHTHFSILPSLSRSPSKLSTPHPATCICLAWL